MSKIGKFVVLTGGNDLAVAVLSRYLQQCSAIAVCILQPQAVPFMGVRWLLEAAVRRGTLSVDEYLRCEMQALELMIREQIAPALSKGQNVYLQGGDAAVLADLYELGAHHFTDQFVEQRRELFSSCPCPDLYVHLDLSPAVARARAAQDRRVSLERFWAPEALFQKTRAGYLRASEIDPDRWRIFSDNDISAREETFGRVSLALEQAGVLPR